MADHKLRTLSYRRASWFAGHPSDTLENLMRQVLLACPTASDTKFLRDDGSVVKIVHRRAKNNEPVYIHISSHILTILGDATAFLPGSWRVISSQAEEINLRSMRLRFIFFFFLLGAFLSIYMIVDGQSSTGEHEFISYLHSVVIVYCFIISIELPQTLRSIQKDRINAIIEGRKEIEREQPAAPIPSEVDKAK